MPILWFEQHVKMSDDIASEVRMILDLPFQGQMMGVIFIIIGVLQISFIPLKNFISGRCCDSRSKVSDLDKPDEDVEPSPEISPLLTMKPKNGIVLLGRINDKNSLRS